MSKLNFTTAVSALLVLSVLVAGQEPLVEIEMTDTHAFPGSEVTVACRVENQGINSIVLQKQFIINDNTEVPAVIFAGPELTKKVIETKRYTLHVINLTKDKILYKVNIINVTAEDAGPYMCVLRGTPLIAAKEFTVYHPVQELKFNNVSIDHGFSVFMMNESATMDLDCSAIGSIPAADVKMFIGDREITNDQTKRETVSSLNCAEVGAKCLTHMSYQKNVMIPDFTVSYKDHNKDLKCVATVPGSKFPPHEAVFKLMVPFAPKFECDLKRHVRMGEMKYKLTCDVLSNPGNPDFQFEFTQGGKTVTLANNESNADGEIKAGQMAKEDGRMQVYLEFSRIAQRHMMAFTLKSSNSIGSNEVVLTLEKDNSVDNGASATTLSTMSVLLFALVRMIL